MSSSNTQLTLDIRPSAAFDFASFIVDENAALVAALQERAVGATTGHLYLWGPNRSGRTHLLKATLGMAYHQRATHYFSSSEMNSSPLPETLGALIAMDDVDQLTLAGQIALFNGLNRAQRFKQTFVLSGNASPVLGLPVRDDLRTRIGQTLIFEVQPLTDAARAAMLTELAARAGLKMESDLVQYILTHGARDPTSLIRTLNALDQASLERKRPLSLSLLRTLMRDGLTI